MVAQHQPSSHVATPTRSGKSLLIRSATGETCRSSGCNTPEPDGRATCTIRPYQTFGVDVREAAADRFSGSHLNRTTRLPWAASWQSEGASLIAMCPYRATGQGLLIKSWRALSLHSNRSDRPCAVSICIGSNFATSGKFAAARRAHGGRPRMQKIIRKAVAFVLCPTTCNALPIMLNI